MDSGVLMAESFDDEQDVARLPAKHLGEFKEKVERLDLDEQRAIVSYFYQLAESTNIFEKDQREIGAAVGMQQHRVSLQYPLW